MVKVEETYNNITDKASKFAEKFDSHKDNSMSGIDTSNLQAKMEELGKEQEQSRITLKDVDNLDAKKLPQEKKPEKPQKDELSPMMPQVSNLGKEAQAAKKTQQQA